MGSATLASAAAASAWAVLVVMSLTALVTKISGKAAYVDAAWGASFVSVVWAAAETVVVHGREPSWRAWVLIVFATLWGGRLTWHLARRAHASAHDDPRYESFLGGRISEIPFPRVVLRVFALQGVLVVAVALPLVVGVVQPVASTTPVIAGSVLTLIGIVFETVSDAQLKAYRSDPERPRILATGLWAWCRHPNYFGDFCVWWGFWLIGGAASGAAWALISVFSPLLMSWILIGVSGVRLAEKRMSGRPGWTAYAARTPVFVPRPPTRITPSKDGIRAE